MALSNISGALLNKGQLSSQENISQKEGNNLGKSALEDKAAGNSYNDSVTLSKSEKGGESTKVLDAKAAEQLLPDIMKAILADSVKALSVQANTRPEAAIDYLSGS